MLLLTLLDNVAVEIQVLIPGHGRLNANVSITIIFLILLLILCPAWLPNQFKLSWKLL